MQAAAPDYTSLKCAIYKSAVSITSFSYDDYGGQPWRLQLLQIWQSFSGLLLLTAAFGFLISRLSSFKEQPAQDYIRKLLITASIVQPSISGISLTNKVTTTIQGLKDQIKSLEDEKTKLETLLLAKMQLWRL